MIAVLFECSSNLKRSNADNNSYRDKDKVALSKTEKE